MPGLGGPAIPRRGRGVVGAYAITAFITVGKLELGLRVTLLRISLKVFGRCGHDVSPANVHGTAGCFA